MILTVNSQQIFSQKN